MKEAIDRFTHIVGVEGCLTDPARIAPFALDWSGVNQSTAMAVVLPKTVQQVQAVMEACYEMHIGVVPQGGNTGSTYAAIPIKNSNQIILSLKNLNKVRRVDVDNYTMTVEAGCLLKDVQEEARRYMRLFPLSLPSENICTIGGNLATNAGGTAVLRYGNMRDLTLGIEVVLPDGRLWNGLSRLRKDNAGYDLKDLFIGAEGTLGVITAAVLKLFPKTPNKKTALITVPKLEDAVTLLNHMKDERGDALTTFEFMLEPCVRLVMARNRALFMDLDAGFEAAILLEVASTRLDPGFSERFMASLLKAKDKKLIQQLIVADDEEMAQNLWAIRNSVPLGLDKGVGGAVTGVIKHDVSVPVMDMPKFIREATKAVHSILHDCHVMPFGHVGDGNIHFNLLPPSHMTPQEFFSYRQQMNDAVYGLALQMGGSFAAEHGIGLMKADRLARMGDPIKLDIMRKIKQSLDPKNIMNPGKVFSNV